MRRKKKQGKTYTLPVYDPIQKRYNICRKQDGRITRTFKHQRVEVSNEFIYKMSKKGYGIEIGSRVVYDYWKELEQREELQGNLLKSYKVEREDFTKEELDEFRNEKTVAMKPIKSMQLRKDDKDLPMVIKDIKVIQDILDLRVKGYSDTDIGNEIKQTHNISNVMIKLYLIDVNDLIKEKASENIQETLKIHTTRYEVLYKWFKANGYDRSAMKALFNKEKINGLHNDVIELEMSNSILPTQKGVEYDLNLLEVNEKREMSKLLSKAKGLEL